MKYKKVMPKDGDRYNFESDGHDRFRIIQKGGDFEVVLVRGELYTGKGGPRTSWLRKLTPDDLESFRGRRLTFEDLKPGCRIWFKDLWYNRPVDGASPFMVVEHPDALYAANLKTGRLRTIHSDEVIHESQ